MIREIKQPDKGGTEMGQSQILGYLGEMAEKMPSSFYPVCATAAFMAAACYAFPALGTMSVCSAGSAAGTYVVGRPSSLRTMLHPWAIDDAL